MGQRLQAEVTYYDCVKNSCILPHLEDNLPEHLNIKRKGAKRQKKVRYSIVGFDTNEEVDEVKLQLEDIFNEAPIEDWKLEDVRIAL